MKEILIQSYNRDAKSYEDKFKELQYEKYSAFWCHKNRVANSGKLKLADFGCGTALLKDFLEETNSNIEYFGIDLSKEMVNIAKLKSENIVLCDINKTEYRDNTFDIITSVTVLRIINDDEKRIIKEMYRVLKPGGVLYLSVLKNRVNELLYDNLAEAGFKLLEEINCGQDNGFICKKVGGKNG